jgi:phosphoribosyl-ATP pyrophosphohydrolase/phosphoribosyl-AMP cyclohydrolase
MKPGQVGSLNWDKGGGLLPAVIQDADSGQVLMLGFMNREALELTLKNRRVTFFSRTRQALWTKGETSGNFLELRSVSVDCDADTLLVSVQPTGPVCHKGTPSCFAEAELPEAARLSFLSRLEDILSDRIARSPDGSYTASLFAQGPTRIAQKIGEEGVEVALAAVGEDDAKIVSETADLLYHVLLLLRQRGLSLTAVAAELELRHANRVASASLGD